MKTVTVEIPEAEYGILSKIAQKLGTTIENLMQQETDRSVETISAWIQRAELIDN